MERSSLLSGSGDIEGGNARLGGMLCISFKRTEEGGGAMLSPRSYIFGSRDMWSEWDSILQRDR